MLDQSDIENSRFPLLKIVAAVIVIGMVVNLASSLVSPALQAILVDVVHLTILAVFLLALLSLLRDHLARSRALHHGLHLNAKVVHRHHKTWGLGSGGQTWRLTLRYELDGTPHESSRSVSEDEYRHASLGASVTIAINRDAPDIWHLPPFSAANRATPLVISRVNRPGAIAFALLTLACIVTVNAARLGMVRGDQAAPWIYSLFLGVIGLAVCAQWWVGKGRVAGPIYLAYIACMFIPPLVIADVDAWMKAVAVTAWMPPAIVVFLDVWSRMKSQPGVHPARP